MKIVFDRCRFADELKLYRNRNDLTQKNLGELVGLNRATINLFENEQQLPSMENLSRVCEAIGKSVEEFFATENQDPILLMMGKLDKADHDTLIRVMDRIQVRKKYISLNKRLGD